MANGLVNFYDSLGNIQSSFVYKNGEVKDISMASDQLHMELLPNDAMKYFLFYPKEIE